MEARDGEIIEGLIGRLGVESLDDVTIVLEMTTQQAVEEELRKGLFLTGSEEARQEAPTGSPGAPTFPPILTTRS